MTTGDEILVMVIDDLEERKINGLVINTESEIDWLMHAYEQALDNVIYLRTVIEQRREKAREVVESV